VTQKVERDTDGMERKKELMGRFRERGKVE